MRTLALDLGTATGWAYGAPGLGVVSGVQHFRPGRFEGGGMRFLRFRSWLDEMRHIARPERIVFEECRRHIGTDAAHLYGGLLAHLSAWCEERGVPYEGIPVGTIKKFATGKGNANKDAMIAAAVARGHHPETDDEADAILLLLMVMQPQAQRSAA